MTDFFAKLAGRALGIEPSPRPVIAPMFAPGPMLAGEYMPEVTREHAALGDIERSPYLVPTSTTQGQLRPTAQPEPRDDPRSDAREYDAQRGADIQQPGPDTIRTHTEQQLSSTSQPEHVSIRPHVQAEPTSMPRSTLIRPQINLQQEQLGSHLTNSRIDPLTPPASAPTIRVSIGRIEVRAVTPPAPSVTKRASPTTPQPSLDEYLQARNRGKR